MYFLILDTRRSSRNSNLLPKNDFSAKGKRPQLIPANYDIKLASQNTVSYGTQKIKKRT